MREGVDRNLVNDNEQNADNLVVSEEGKVSVRARDPYQALRYSNFRLVFFGGFIAAIGEKMLEVALGWELYERTHSPLILGGVGLVLVIPVLLFSLPAGHVADRFNRKWIVFIAQCGMALSCIGLTWLSYTQGPIPFIYGCLLLMGCATAFSGPANGAMNAQVVPDVAYENASTWSSSSWQLASMVGPGLGGIFIALFNGAAPVYLLTTLLAVMSAILVALIRLPARAVVEHKQEATTWSSIVEGLHFLRHSPIIMSAITLDLFAVLLGGATTLLPIYATMLHVGPIGLGWLRAAPSIGAIIVALLLAHLPPLKKAGITLLLAVAGFGVATIIFGLSHSFWLSIVMLLLLGGLDNISVVVRGTLLLTRTPDEMRGRVSAVNALFIGASNELGGFESGLTAQLFGPLLSVVGGGIGTILVVVLVALLWPEMRRLGTLRAAEHEVI